MMRFEVTSVRLSVSWLAIVFFSWLWGGFPNIAFAERSAVKNVVGTREQATVKAGKSSLKVSQTKAGAAKTQATKKISSQSAPPSAALKSVRKDTATKIIPQKQFQKTTTSSMTVLKTASPKSALSKNSAAISKTTTAKSSAIISKKGTTASSKTSVQKSPIVPKVKTQASSNTFNTKGTLKSSQAASPKQTAFKTASKPSITQPKPSVSGTSGGTCKPSPALPVKSTQPAFSLNTSVRLSDVAKQLRLKYSANGQSIILCDGRHRFEFRSGTKEAMFDGIKIFLSFPIETPPMPTTRLKKLAHQLRLVTPEHRIRTADVENILKPLLFPQNFVKKRAKTIVIDPGHGGKAEGTVQNGLKEKLLTLKTAQLLAGKLRSMGYVVHLTRTTDADVFLSQRSAFANMKHADLFISIHYNSAPSEQARGIEVFAFPLAGYPSSDQVVTKEFNSMPINAFDGQSSILGWQVQKKIIPNTGSIDRGVKRKRLGVLRELNCPGILIECGFLSHPTESKICNSADYQEKLTRAIADGIRAYNGS
ncbi:MAG: N-acetylmuramoyl-L-alanine amidase [Opitutales bacterium]|nr:N-acetylmuramoyl-L-alanine amidase [Opitutales bacterium]